MAPARTRHRQPAPLRTPIHRRPGRSGQRRARRLKPRRRPPIGSSHATHRPHLPGAGLRGGCAAARRGRRRARHESQQGSTPKITRVTPMRVRVGALLTIRGRNFRAGRSKNTVIFRGPDGAAPSRSRGRRAARSWSCAYPRPSRARRQEREHSEGDSLQAARARGQVQQVHSRRLSPVVVPAGSGADTGGAAAAAPPAAPGTTMTATCCPTPPRWRSSSTRASRTPTATRSRTAMSTRRPSTSTTIRHAAAALPGQATLPKPARSR